MGLFSFVTDAGGALGSSIYDMLNDDEDINKPATISPERMSEIRTKGMRQALDEEFGDTVSNVVVAVNVDAVTLTGTIADQETCEKVTLSAGNRHGITSVDCQIEVEQTAPEAVFYTVKPGDSLSKIAKEVYQNAGKYGLIFEANKPMLTDPNKIYPGQTLRIPPLS
ncbi:peptidoglycan-binding protein LysM [Teredinibacter waterburyi]|jgi:Uncharacterized protein containing LysM domain|uniref:peptidoglycan-binding protein LysM n=1 Tax=Teredinibacter waterburyi TaxID=1500538 RepID=UPI00165F5013|nr:peptidoglycan-binding protein LysM [Teredinibacter waterburyi]